MGEGKEGGRNISSNEAHNMKHAHQALPPTKRGSSNPKMVVVGGFAVIVAVAYTVLYSHKKPEATPVTLLRSPPEPPLHNTINSASLSSHPKLSHSLSRSSAHLPTLLRRRNSSLRPPNLISAKFVVFKPPLPPPSPPEFVSTSSSILLDVTGMMCGACVLRVKSILTSDMRVKLLGS